MRHWQQKYRAISIAIHRWRILYAHGDGHWLLFEKNCTQNTFVYVMLYANTSDCLSSLLTKHINFISKMCVLAGTWLILSMMCGILMNFVSNFHVIMVCFVAFVCCGVCSSIIMAVAVNAYPTNYRAMATSFIMMAGRIGSVSGSNFIGLMLGNYCTWVFYVFGGLLVSKCI